MSHAIDRAILWVLAVIVLVLPVLVVTAVLAWLWAAAGALPTAALMASLAALASTVWANS